MESYDNKHNSLIENFIYLRQFRLKVYNLFHEDLTSFFRLFSNNSSFSLLRSLSYDRYLLIIMLISFLLFSLINLLTLDITLALMSFIFVLLLLYFFPFLNYLRKLNIIHRELLTISSQIVSFSNFISIYELIRLIAENQDYLISKNFKMMLKRINEGNDFSSSVKHSFSDYSSNRLNMFLDLLIISYQTGNTKDIFSSSYHLFYKAYIDDIKRFSSFYTLLIFVFVSFGIIFPLLFNSVTFFFDSDINLSLNFLISIKLLILLLLIEFVNPSFELKFLNSYFLRSFLFSFIIFIIFVILIVFSDLSIILFFSIILFSYSLFRYFKIFSYYSINLEEIANSYLHISTLDSILSFEDMVKELSKAQYGKISIIYHTIYSDMKKIGTENAIKRFFSISTLKEKKLFDSVNSILIKELVSNLLMLYRIGSQFKIAIISAHQQLLKFIELEKEKNSLLRLPRYALIISIVIFPIFFGILNVLKDKSSILVYSNNSGEGYLFVYIYFVIYSVSTILSINSNKDLLAVVGISLSIFYPIYFLSMLFFST
ncbi:MAG: type II secretion system F family protein [Candidatus Aenigmatarchaeota archaeon]